MPDPHPTSRHGSTTAGEACLAPTLVQSRRPQTTPGRFGNGFRSAGADSSICWQQLSREDVSALRKRCSIEVETPRASIASLSAVHTFDPNRSARPDAVTIERILRASNESDQPDFGLSSEEVQKFAPLMRLETALWREVIARLDDQSLVALVRFFTLAEQLPGWLAGERSPVIPLMSELRARNAVPADLGSWIRSNSENRFLPWGSLLDRL